MRKIIIKFDPNNGSVCPDAKLMNYARHFVGDTSSGEETVCIGSDALVYAFRVLHKKKELEIIHLEYEQAANVKRIMYFDEKARASGGIWYNSFVDDMLEELLD
jgi:hypothetical protein